VRINYVRNIDKKPGDGIAVADNGNPQGFFLAKVGSFNIRTFFLSGFF